MAMYPMPGGALANAATAVAAPGALDKLTLAQYLASSPRMSAALGGIAQAPVGPEAGNIAGSMAKINAIGAEPLTEVTGPGRLATMFGEGGRLAAGGVGRAGLYGLGGIAAGQLENKLVGEHGNTSWDEAATGALTGAGIGAGLGSFLPGAGTVIGGALGAGIGGAIGLFGHKSTGQKAVHNELVKQTTALARVAATLHLDADTTNLITQQLGAFALNAKSESEVRAAADQIAQQLPQLAQAALAQKQDNLRAMAVQSAMSSFASPYLQQAATQSALTHSQLNDAADQIGGKTGELLKLHAQETRSGQDSLLAAYASQIAMSPQTAQYDTLTSLRNQANSQLYAKLAGQAAGSGQNTTSLAQSIQSLGQGQG